MERYKLIERVLNGTATESEKERLERWIAISRENEDEYNDYKTLIESGMKKDTPSDTFSDDFERIRRTISINKIRRKWYGVTVFMTIVITSFFVIRFFVTMPEAESYHRGKEIRFENTHLVQLADSLSARFNIVIEIPAELETSSFTGTLYCDSAEDAVRMIAASLGLKYEVKGDSSFRVYR